MDLRAVHAFTRFLERTPHGTRPGERRASPLDMQEPGVGAQRRNQSPAGKSALRRPATRKTQARQCSDQQE
ncbi:hypothetical protein ROLI_012820 [Roseobacter fucihabitans]|uniref:Uncharacterized protein n=1 Tax=Roseobacter fucihabitans TaxID=1537242 RepID=A0ABZ2BTK5_9RHOB|nr:hypothetical protein [Roseobacter litoralis]